ncbi:polyphosphate kinase [Leptospira sp. 201903070]|uniref:Polyphosphate kinase n=1 Tax=Leptospira ainlahdjerensis TaxID=2810033 RepID=A0ABS2UHP5_9LEPT|nr:PPK2 family polyphosphate kinase [Leptospira ainlahdjerensis]MBM9579319.1 polyphosphate kinase [Leptospira ainlahdjerensis]
MNLKDVSTLPSADKNKEEVLLKTEEYLKDLYKLQEKLYAKKEHSVLILLQGVDTSGKDGTIKHVFAGLNPQGCSVKAWSKPNSEEVQYDFLWRIHKYVPSKGTIYIHNRSHYEDVIMPIVQKNLPEKRIKERMESIRNFEKHLLKENNTLILKFFLHISKEIQKERIEERINNPDKKWKYDPSDEVTQDRWEDYRAAYETIFNEKDQEQEWNLIPSDKKWYRNYKVAKIICKELEKIVS